MQQALNKISRRVSALLAVILNFAQKQTDHKCLAHHIIAQNKMQTSAQIINEAALCLKNIVNYRLFAFVVKKENGIDVWLDPNMYLKTIEDIILKDFPLTTKEGLNYLNQGIHQSENVEKKFNLDNLVSYELKEKECCAKIYLVPDHVTSNNSDLVNLVLQSTMTALSRLNKIKILKNAAVIDPLTGCYNRREFTNQLRRNIAGAIRNKGDLSLFILDIDHFKKINDTYGHLAGDKVLCEIVSLVQKNMRTNDTFARYGGEEFIAILPATGKIKAMELADRLRKKIEEKIITYKNDTIKVTASFGVAQMNQSADMEKIIHDADTMMYKAKQNGRNIVMPGIIKLIPDQILAKG